MSIFKSLFEYNVFSRKSIIIRAIILSYLLLLWTLNYKYHLVSSAPAEILATNLSFSSRIDLARIELSEASKSGLQRRLYLLDFTDKIITRDWGKDISITPLDRSITKLGKTSYWTYWNKNFKKAPLLVRKCNARLTKMLPPNQYQIIHLDDKSLKHYVSFPKHIIDKRSAMTTTYFSDLIRLELLTSYGGMWGDATVYIASPVPDEVTDADFFAYSN